MKQLIVSKKTKKELEEYLFEKEEDNYYYKLCREVNQNLFRSCILDSKSPLNCFYKLNEITWSNFGSIGLLVFKSFSNLLNFIECFEFRLDLKILKGKAIEPVKEIELLLSIHLVNSDFAFNQNRFLKLIDDVLNKKWESISPSKKYSDIIPAPLGTYACVGFKPLKIIESWK